MLRRIGACILDELRGALPPTIFFFVGFNFIVLTTNLLVADYAVAISNFMLVTVAALVVGKAVITANAMPFFKLFDRAPLIQPILFKTAIYWIATFIARLAEHWLLTLLTAVFMLMIFIFAPLQAAGIFLFQTFAIAGLLAIVGGAVIISGNPIALGLMSIAFIANFAVFFFRLYYPWPYNLHLLAGAWLIIAVTIGLVVARAVFGRGRITYHRIVGSDPSLPVDCCCLRNAVRVCGPVDFRCIQGDRVQGRFGTRQFTFLFQLCHPDIDGLRRHRSRASAGAKSLQSRMHHRPTLSGNDFGQACNSRIASR